MSTFNLGDNVTVLVAGDGAQATIGALGDGATGTVVTHIHQAPAPADPPKADKPKGRHAK